MLLGERIKYAIVRAGTDPNKVAAAISMSTANLYRIFKKNSIETKYLYAICEVLNLPITYFLLDENGNFPDWSVTDAQAMREPKPTFGAIKDLKDNLDRANRVIATLEARIHDKDLIINLLQKVSGITVPALPSLVRDDEELKEVKAAASDTEN